MQAGPASAWQRTKLLVHGALRRFGYRLIPIPLSSLDEGLRALLEAEGIDVQGYERQVLDGAPETLARVRGLQVEMSLRPVYEGQMLFLPMLLWLDGLGFRPARFAPVFIDPVTGRWLQVDGLFLREG